MNIRRLVLVVVVSLISMRGAAQCAAPDAATLQKDVAKYKTVTVTVDDCFVQLNGQVNRLSDAWDVERKFRHSRWAAGVTNYISIAAPAVDDSKLRRNVVDMVNGQGYSDLRAPLWIGVQRGVVTLNGVEPNPMLQDSMLYAVASVKGVRAIVSTVHVDPLLNVDEIVEWSPRTPLLWNERIGPMFPRQ